MACLGRLELGTAQRQGAHSRCFSTFLVDPVERAFGLAGKEVDPPMREIYCGAKSLACFWLSSWS